MEMNDNVSTIKDVFESGICAVIGLGLITLCVFPALYLIANACKEIGRPEESTGNKD